MNRKQKAIEDRCREQHDYKRPAKVDAREETDLEQMQDYIKKGRSWGYLDVKIRIDMSNYYKNGAKLFDKAIALENSPLMKALS